MNFWSQFTMGHCYPSCGCEPLLDAIIMQPLAFWSSLAYLVTAIMIYRRVEKKNLELKLWTWTLVYLTFSSMFAHASYTRLALAMDFSSIVVLISLFTFYNLLLLLKQSKSRIIFWTILYISVLISCFYYMGGWARIGICLLIFFFAVGDLVRDMRTELFRARARPFWNCLWILAASFVAFVVDTTGVVCTPDSWIHGHTIWHFGTAVSAYFYGVWRFKLPRRFDRRPSNLLP